MLSILIPTYNYVCYELVNELQEQAVSLSIPFEILVADDASTIEETKQNNRSINTLTHCQYIELEENLGRAKIRNFLGEKAQYEYLLFLDSDIRICENNFLEMYLNNIQGNRVLCGVTKFKRRIPDEDKTLRYTYGVTQEEKTASTCNKKPYGQFTSINFLMPKETFNKVKFNPVFTKYGHEDTLLGKELEAAKIPVYHIDNPIYHNVPDTNEEFLNKTHSSIKNALIHKELLESHVRILQVYAKVQKYKGDILLYFLYRLLRKRLLNNLLGTKPNMKVFAFYKLGYMCELEKKMGKELSHH